MRSTAVARRARGAGVWSDGPGRWLAVALVGFAAVFLAVGCGGEGSGEAGASPKVIRATTTTNFVTDLVEQVGGDRVEATGLMGPGVDPHLYQPSQGDVQTLQEADAIFYSGLHLEGQMGDIFVKLASQTPTVPVADVIPKKMLLEPPEFAGAYDPHVWWDPMMWKMTVDPVVEQLSEIKPDSADYFEQRGEEYKQKIEEAHAFSEERLSEIPEDQRVLVTSHDAYNYFGERYGFEVKGLQGISTESEAGAGDVQDVADYLVENEIPAVFVETSVPRRNIEAVQAAARDQGWEVEIGGELYSDAIGDPGTPGGTYPGAAKENAETIAGGLSQ